MASDAQKVGEALRRQVELAVKALILEIDRNLRRKPPAGTPVDTGHARRNWVPSVGAPFDGETVGSAAHDAGVARVVQFKLADGAAFITNNTPYIDRLNYGTSKQSPAGFIEQAIAEAQATIEAKFGMRIEIDPTSIGTSFTRDRLTAELAGNLAGAYSPFGDD